jgi:hypothetical protein
VVENQFGYWQTYLLCQGEKKIKIKKKLKKIVSGIKPLGSQKLNVGQIPPKK